MRQVRGVSTFQRTFEKKGDMRDDVNGSSRVAVGWRLAIKMLSNLSTAITHILRHLAGLALVPRLSIPMFIVRCACVRTQLEWRTPWGVIL